MITIIDSKSADNPELKRLEGMVELTPRRSARLARKSVAAAEVTGPPAPTTVEKDGHDERLYYGSNEAAATKS